MIPIKYELIVCWSEADDAFIVEVSELAGCIADGQSYAEAVANAEIIIQDMFSKWFDTIRTGRYLIAVTVTNDLTKRHWIITAYTARKLTGGNS